MRIHDTRTGEVVGELAGIGATQVAADGTLIGVGADIIQYDFDTLQPLGTFPPVRAWISSRLLRLSDDGRILMAISHDRTVSLFDVASRARLGEPIPFDVPALAGSSVRPDGMAVAIGGSDGITIWDIDPQHLTAAACRLAGRNLIPAEWDTYLTALGSYRPTCPDNSTRASE